MPALPYHDRTEAYLRMVARMAARSERALEGAPDYPKNLVELADNLARQGHLLSALGIFRKANALGLEAITNAVRRRLANYAPGYHLPMMNDARRNEAWDRALRRAIRPGMRVLEIGTGAGMLALMAARAGAGRVTTCEIHFLVSAIAREIVEKNGYADKVDVLFKSSLDLQVGADLAERAELVFCDNFSDNLFSFRPMESIADARKRLLTPGARSVPAAVALRVALCDWNRYARFFNSDQVAGFDISPASVFLSESLDLEIGDPGVQLRSEAEQPLRYDLSLDTFATHEVCEVELVASHDGEVNGIAQWIRLELDEETCLEARPEPGARFFSNPRFYPLPSPRHLKAGERLRVRVEHDGENLNIWAI